MASGFKILDGTGAFQVIAAAATEIGREIKITLATALSRCIESNVDCILQHLRDYAFPTADIGFDGVRDRNAFVIDVATDSYEISEMKLGGIYTPDFCLGINSENPSE